MSIQGILKCTDIEPKALDEIEYIVIHDTLLLYLYFNKYFYIDMDDSGFHLVSVIVQYGTPIAFYIQKLTGGQIRFTVTESN